MIFLQPFAADPDPGLRELLPLLAQGLQSRYRREVAVLPGVDDPADDGSETNGQRSTRRYHALLAGLALPKPGAVLGITRVDLFAPHMTFVFGEADPVRRVAIMSLHRLRSAPTVFQRRALVEAVHELGHVFGLAHCTSPACVMYFSSHIAESDRKGPDFCTRCRALF